ncbi:MAG: hypothetical protein ACKVOO_03595 [Burkholderiaceae bacterium]
MLQWFFVGIVLLAAPGAVWAADLSKQDKALVLAVANSVSKATEARHIDGVMAVMSQDVQFVQMIPGRKPIMADYSSYRQYIGKLFPLAKKIEYSRSQEIFEYGASQDELIFTFKMRLGVAVTHKPMEEATSTQTWHLRRTPAGLKVFKLLISP